MDEYRSLVEHMSSLFKARLAMITDSVVLSFPSLISFLYFSSKSSSSLYLFRVKLSSLAAVAPFTVEIISFKSSSLWSFGCVMPLFSSSFLIIKFSNFFLHFYTEILYQVTFRLRKHYLESSCQMMVLKYRLVRITDCKRMFCPNYKLITVAGMFKVMH